MGYNIHVINKNKGTIKH